MPEWITLSWGGKTLNKKTVLKDSVKKLFHFIHHPKVRFNFNSYTVLEKDIKGGIAYRPGKQAIPCPSPPIALNLLHKFRDINLETGRECNWLELKTADFDLIKQFWIEHYANSELYEKIKNIIKLADRKDINLWYQFKNLISTDLIVFTSQLQEVQQTYLTFWLNFIFNIENGFDGKQSFSFSFKGGEMINFEEHAKLNSWRSLRNYLIHPYRKRADLNLELLKFSSDAKNFVIKLGEKNKKKEYTIQFNWGNFTLFRNKFLKHIEEKLKHIATR